MLRGMLTMNQLLNLRKLSDILLAGLAWFCICFQADVFLHNFGRFK